MLKCGTHLGRDTCFIRDRSRHLPSPTHTHNPHTPPPQLQEEFGFGVVCCVLGIGLTKYDPPLPRPVESFSRGGGTGSREGKLSLGSWDPASDQYHPSTKHQQTPLWGLTHPGAAAWPRNQVCSTVLPSQ